MTYGDALQAVGKPIQFDTKLTKNQHKSLNLSFPLDDIFESFNLALDSQEITIESDLPFLGIKKGQYPLQKLLYLFPK